MNEYDAVLKRVLQRLTPGSLKQVIGFPVTIWHNVDLPLVRSPRADLLGETPEGQLVHIELQSTNDPDMGLRMAEYALAICNKFGRMPVQMVLYVGWAAPRMAATLAGPHLSFECSVVDVRDLDGEPWLASDCLHDNLLAILFHFANQRDMIRTILRRIAASEPASRPHSLTELLLLARLRKAGDIIKREAEQMPILNDIMDDEVFGPILQKGMAIGRDSGRKEGVAAGLKKGVAAGLKKGVTVGRYESGRAILMSLLARRFGPVPVWAKTRIEEMSASELERAATNVLDAVSLDQLLR